MVNGNAKRVRGKKWLMEVEIISVEILPFRVISDVYFAYAFVSLPAKDKHVVHKWYLEFTSTFHFCCVFVPLSARAVILLKWFDVWSDRLWCPQGLFGVRKGCYSTCWLRKFYKLLHSLPSIERMKN